MKLFKKIFFQLPELNDEFEDDSESFREKIKITFTKKTKWGKQIDKRNYIYFKKGKIDNVDRQILTKL